MGIGERGNVFAIGLLIYDIMWRQGRRADNDGLFKYANPIIAPGPIYTARTYLASTPTIAQMPPMFPSHGRALLRTSYSIHLIELIQACLAYHPGDRLTAENVMNYVIPAIALIDATNVAAGTNQPVDFGNLPPPPGPRHHTLATMRAANIPRSIFYRARSVRQAVLPWPVSQGPLAGVVPLAFPPTVRRTLGPRP